MIATSEWIRSVAGTGPSACRLLLVDDDQQVRSALAPLLERWGFLVVGALASANEMGEAVVRQRPDVVVLDMNMPGRNPLHAIEELRYRGSPVKVLVLSALADAPTVAACMAAGAQAYVLKSDSVDALHEGLQAVIEGRRYASPGVAASDRRSYP